jgi:hypothetical protein
MSSALRNKGKGQGQYVEKEDHNKCRVYIKAIQITMMALLANAVFVFLYMTGWLEFKREDFDIIVTTIMISLDLLLFAFLHFFTERG